ncbi:hypothetical protein PIB30_085182 [Stylosanthes scabra]|uniref:Uncharacterized protein n=1 Tax=Stylosanthes scabra TaxID=79078 RepID=A0ABU6QSA9_9FABA|nr:hypothetical protein [Stylosanthes scabra]
MGYQSSGSPQRPKGATIKMTLKIILVLVVCAWLVYQIKHSMNKKGSYDHQTEHVLGYGAVLLGRKGLDERDLPDLRDADSVGEAKESSNGRDDHNAEQESVNFTNKGSEVEHESESQPKKSSSRTGHKDSYLEESGKAFIEREFDHKEYVIDNYQEKSIEDVATSNKKGGEEQQQLKETPNAESDFSAKENDKDIEMQEKVIDKATDVGVAEVMDDVLSFHDENGVPPDGNETKIVAHEENIFKVSKGIRLGKSNAYKVTFGEDKEVGVSLEGQENNATAVEEFNFEAFTHGDTSGIKYNGEIEGGDGKAL